jgi:hypothetical protein
MNFKKPNNKRFGKKKARAFELRQWRRKSHKSNKIIEEIKKEKYDTSD